MSQSRPISAEDKRWRAEADAHTLAEAEAIKRDPARLKAAQKAAKTMAKEAEDKALGMRTVASSKALRPAKRALRK